MDYSQKAVENIKKILADRSMSITQLAEKINVPQTTLNAQLNSKKGIPVNTLIAVADYLGIDILLLCERSDSDNNTDDYKRHIDTAYASLNDEGRQRLVQYADDLAGMEKYKRTSEQPKKKPAVVLTAASDGSVGGSYVTGAEADIEKANQLGAQAVQREKDRRNYSKTHGKKPKR